MLEKFVRREKSEMPFRRRCCAFRIMKHSPITQNRAYDAEQRHGKGAGNLTTDNESRENYRHFLAIPTRWMDNDIYGHVNNVIYYSYFDTVINEYLMREGGLDPHAGTVVGVAVETMCRFRKSLTFPQIVDAGLRVGKLGKSSVRYEVGLFAAGDAEPAATGHFVHVFVERPAMRPVPIPDRLRACMEQLLVE